MDPERGDAGLAARLPSQISREPLQGSRQLLVFKVPQGPTGRVIAEQPECGHQLAEPHLGAESPDRVHLLPRPF